MKKLLLVLSILFSTISYGQTIYTGTFDSSIKVPVNISGAVRTMYGLDFINKGLTTARIPQDATHRFATDVEKSTWNGKQDALGFTPYNATNPSGFISRSGISATGSLSYNSTTGVFSYTQPDYSGTYQPVENQRLGTSNTPSFAGGTFTAPITITAQGSTPVAPAANTNIIYGNATGVFTIMGSNGFGLSFNKSHLTASHQIYAQNLDYTAADSARVEQMLPLAGGTATGRIYAPSFSATNEYRLRDSIAFTHNSGRLFVGLQAGNTTMTGDYNYAFGRQTLSSMTSGEMNIAIGSQAMRFSTTAREQVAIGYQALLNYTGETDAIQNGLNTAIGSLAMTQVTQGIDNVAIGQKAGAAASILRTSVVIGAHAGGFDSASTTVAIGRGSFDKGTGTGLMTGSNLVGIGDAISTQAGAKTNSVLIGHYANRLGKTIANTVMIGAGAGEYDSTSTNGTYVGYQAGGKNQANELTAGGYLSFSLNTTGVRNTGWGAYSGNNNTTSNDNTALGYKALTAYINGTDGATAIGSNAAIASTTGAPTAIGYKALSFNTIGTGNTAVGTSALAAATTANNNTAIGNTALNNATGSANTGGGYRALATVAAGANNTAFGSEALSGSTGSGSVAVGRLAGNSSGSGGIYIGAGAGQNETGSNKLYIANTNTTTPLILGDMQSTIAASSVLINGKLKFPATITTTGTTGNQTINNPAGTVNIAAGGTSVTVTNSLVTTSSLINVELRTNDATAWIKNYVPASGSFTINLGAATTGEVSIHFIVYN